MLLDTGCKDSWVPVKQEQLWHAHLQRCQYSMGGLCITIQITRPLAANIAVKTSVFTTTLLQRQCAAVHAPNSHCRQHTQGQQEQVPVREAPNMHCRQQTKVNKKRCLSERHPTYITGSRPKSTGRGTCQKGTQHASQAAEKGQQEEVPVRNAPHIHLRQQTIVSRKRFLSDMHPTCITGSRPRSTGRGTCQRGRCGGGQAAHQGL